MSDAWAEWEPPEWVAARGPYLTIASEHFAVRLEADGAERERITRAAPSLLKPQDLLRWGSRPLMTVAESPGASDVEGSEAGSLKKR